MTYAAVAEGLNVDRIPTGQGGVRWYPSTVRAVLSSQAAEDGVLGNDGADGC